MALKQGGSRVLASIALLLPSLCVADLPVHCLRHQIAGDWEFHLAPPGPKRDSCGHKRPDGQYVQPRISSLATLGQSKTIKVSLSHPDIARGENGTTGTWTMIYDEGFEVALGDQVFFAFSKFSFVQGKEQQNVSHCDRTQIGWYHNEARSKWGCYVGAKVGAAPDPDGAPTPPPATKVSLLVTSAFAPEEASQDEDDSDEDDDAPLDSTTTPAQQDDRPHVDSANAPDASAAAVKTSPKELATTAADAPTPAQAKPPLSEAQLQKVIATPVDYKPWVPSNTSYDTPLKSEMQTAIAEALNFLQLGWKATMYKMFSGRTIREINNFAGVRRHRSKPQHVGRPSRSSAAAGFSSFLEVKQTFKSVDWRERHGRSWLQPVVSQGDCGSCYVIATVHMLVARNRIRKHDPSEPAFSIAFPLHCAEYNQGCDGGYGFLETKWNEDVGLIPERCAPYNEGAGSCQLKGCDLGSKRYRATNHHYVGGFYGASDADAIAQELVANGPLVMSFEPREDFMYYKNGIYRSGPQKIHQEWQQVDHAVLLTGYGEEDKKPYWHCQNSWGDDWGEAGFFRMARGIDESGCESIAVAGEVVEESSNPILDDFITSIN